MTDTTDLSFIASLYIRTSDTAKSSRHFVDVPEDVSTIIRELTKDVMKKKKGWKSVKVEVRIGFVTRETSLFPPAGSPIFLLPIKKSIRKELKIGEGSEVLVYLKVLE